MATIPDVTLTGTAYQNLYAAAGIVIGTAVTVQNKSGSPVYLQNVASQPSGGSTSGYLLLPNSIVDVTGAIGGLWAKGKGPVMIEAIG